MSFSHKNHLVYIFANILERLHEKKVERDVNSRCKTLNFKEIEAQKMQVVEEFMKGSKTSIAEIRKIHGIFSGFHILCRWIL